MYMMLFDIDRAEIKLNTNIITRNFQQVKETVKEEENEPIHVLQTLFENGKNPGRGRRGPRGRNRGGTRRSYNNNNYNTLQRRYNTSYPHPKRNKHQHLNTQIKCTKTNAQFQSNHKPIHLYNTRNPPKHIPPTIKQNPITPNYTHIIHSITITSIATSNSFIFAYYLKYQRSHISKQIKFNIKLNTPNNDIITPKLTIYAKMPIYLRPRPRTPIHTFHH